MITIRVNANQEYRWFETRGNIDGSFYRIGKIRQETKTFQKTLASLF